MEKSFEIICAGGFKLIETTIRYICFPRTEPPPNFVANVAGVFQKHEIKIGTKKLVKGLTSNEVLGVIRNDLVELSFDVEAGKQKEDKIERPVFFGENGQPTLKYEIDAYHPIWRCGLEVEVEAGRAWMGNAVYRDLIQALTMVQVDTLVLAVPNITTQSWHFYEGKLSGKRRFLLATLRCNTNSYKYKSSGRLTISSDYDNAVNVAETLFGHSRFKLPYNLVMIGY